MIEQTIPAVRRAERSRETYAHVSPAIPSGSERHHIQNVARLKMPHTSDAIASPSGPFDCGSGPATIGGAVCSVGNGGGASSKG